MTAPLRAVDSLPPPKCAQHLPALRVNPHPGKKGKRAHSWQRRKIKKEKKGRMEEGELCANRSGGARSRFTRGWRPWSGFRRRSCGSDTRTAPNIRPGTRGMLRAAGEGPGLQGLRAPLGPGLLRAARPSGAASLPRAQPLPGASYCRCHPHLSRDGEGGMRGPPRSLARGSPPLAAARGWGLGRPEPEVVPVAVPGGTRGCGHPSGAGVGKSSRGGEEGPAGAAGETERVSPTAGPRGIPVPRQGAPGEQRLLWDTAWSQLAPAPGRPEMFFLTIS